MRFRVEACSCGDHDAFSPAQPLCWRDGTMGQTKLVDKTAVAVYDDYRVVLVDTTGSSLYLERSHLAVSEGVELVRGVPTAAKAIPAVEAAAAEAVPAITEVVPAPNSSRNTAAAAARTVDAAHKSTTKGPGELESDPEFEAFIASADLRAGKPGTKGLKSRTPMARRSLITPTDKSRRRLA